jgi:signal transduction histidine kinase
LQLNTLLRQEVITIIQQLRNISKDQQKAIIQNIRIPNAIISTNKIPLWSYEIEHQNLWQINKTIKLMKRYMQFSLLLKNNLWLNVNVDLKPINTRLNQLAFGLFSFIFCLGLLILWLLYRLNAPLKTITKKVHHLSVDIDAAPLKTDGPPIVRNTFKAINDMQKQIKALLSDRALMLASISHDLRTPLTRMRLRSEFIQDEKQNQKNMSDIEEMETMISQVITYAKSNVAEIPKTTIDLTSLVISICNDFIDHGKNITYEGIEESVIVNGNTLSLKRAFIWTLDKIIINPR